MKNTLYDSALLGERIKRARKAKRFTQAEVSEMIDMSSKNFSQLERGMTGLSVSTLVALCRVLDVSADYFLFGDEKKSGNSALYNLFSELDESDRIYAERLIEVFVESRRRR